MTRPFIEQVLIRNYGCIGDLTLELTPLHALIGPNDSGKSTVLGALRTVTLRNSTNQADRGTQEAARLWQALTANAEAGQVDIQVTAGGGSYRLQVLRGSEVYESSFQGKTDPGSTGNTRRAKAMQDIPLQQLDAPLAEAIAGSQLLRLDPDALRQSSTLIPEGTPVRLSDSRGRGLPGVYDAIQNRDLQAFIAINEEITRLFPTVKALSLKNPNQTTKALHVKLEDGTDVSASFMSEGLLYFLAFAALRYLEPTPIVLIEEPENGLHPARIAEVMAVLREMSKSTQIVLATHSPLVINEMKGDEVTVLTRSTERDVSAVRMKDTPSFEERSKVYALGELWVSYANGHDEGPLVRGGPRP